MLNIVSWAKTGSVWCWHIWTCSVCVTGKRERVRCSHIWTCSLRYRQKGKSVMLTFLNMFTVLQAKHREYDAHIFEHVHCVADKTEGVWCSHIWTSYCVTGKTERVMLLCLNTFTVLQAKHREYDAHTFEHIHCVTGKTERVWCSHIWSQRSRGCYGT